MQYIHPITDKTYEEYLRDESRSTGWAEAIAFPQDEEQVREILKAARDSHTPVTVQGARTGLTGAAVPYGGYILNMSRMSKILGLRQEGDSLFIRVQPGLLLTQLNKMLEQKSFDVTGWSAESQKILENIKAGQWIFPPDPTEISASIGGMVSCNASGAKTFFYGPTRNYVEAIRAVLPGGDVITVRRGSSMARGRDFDLVTESGRHITGRLPSYTVPKVKSAAGYYIDENMDLIDLFIGAEGTLGVITEIELKLVKAPAMRIGTVAFLQDRQSALVLVRALRKEALPEGTSPLPVLPLSIEYFDRRALALLKDQQQSNPAFSQLQPLPDGIPEAVYAEFDGADDDKAWEILSGLGTLVERSGGNEHDTWVALDGQKMEKLRFFRHACPECVNIQVDQCRKSDPRITKLGTDMSVPAQYLDPALDMYEKDLTEAGLNFVIFGHIGQNHLHVNVIPRSIEEYDKAKALYMGWARTVSAWGGSVAAEHGIGKLKAPFLRAMYSDSQLAEMAALKAVFDPEGLLCAGNIFSSSPDSDMVSAVSAGSAFGADADTEEKESRI